MNLAELAFVPLTCNWINAGSINFIDFSINYNGTPIHKAMRISSKMETAMRNAHGRRITARRSEIKHRVYMLLYCHTTTTMTKHELEEDTSTVMPNGQVIAPTFPPHRYLLEMMQRFLEEVADEQL